MYIFYTNFIYFFVDIDGSTQSLLSESGKI